MNQSTDSDIYVNEGETFSPGAYYPDEPAEQKEEIQAQNAVIAASYPVMESVAEWFKEQIEQAKSIDNIQLSNIDGYTAKVSIEGQILAYRLLGQLLTDKSQEFKRFLKEEE